MKINNEFSLFGFDRENRGEDGAVFLRYEEPKDDERKVEISKSPMYYGGFDTENYVLSVPKPKAKRLVACVVVARTSKNKYFITMFDKKAIITFRATSWDDIQESCKQFFND